MRISDWSSDVCSSDLGKRQIEALGLNVGAAQIRDHAAFAVAGYRLFGNRAVQAKGVAFGIAEIALVETLPGRIAPGDADDFGADEADAAAPRVALTVLHPDVGQPLGNVSRVRKIGRAPGQERVWKE